MQTEGPFSHKNLEAAECSGVKGQVATRRQEGLTSNLPNFSSPVSGGNSRIGGTRSGLRLQAELRVIRGRKRERQSPKIPPLASEGFAGGELHFLSLQLVAHSWFSTDVVNVSRCHNTV